MCEYFVHLKAFYKYEVLLLLWILVTVQHLQSKRIKAPVRI